MIFKREIYIEKLLSKCQNGLVKVVTGLRRSGKSYLLFELYRAKLLANGIKEEQIISINLEDDANILLWNPVELSKYVKEKIKKNDLIYYVFIDEIQRVITIKHPQNQLIDYGYVEVVLGLHSVKNIDLYVTGSNSKLLTKDIVTEFRGRGDEIYVQPLSYREFLEAGAPLQKGRLSEYLKYGGLPLVVLNDNPTEKEKYLSSLFLGTYIKDILERYKIEKESNVIKNLLKIISSSVGSLINTTKISNAFRSVSKTSVSYNTLDTYLGYLSDAFLIKESLRFDIKGKKYIGALRKLYFTDLGLRNSLLDFRQVEENHLMENAIFNELIFRGFNVDIGIVERKTSNPGEKNPSRVFYEIDFIASKGHSKYYIQSAFQIPDDNKREQETRPLYLTNDSFRKIIIVKDDITTYQDEKGIIYVSLENFLLDEKYLS